jgi:hypothetical protein
MQHPELLVVDGVVEAGLQPTLPARHTVPAGRYVVALSILLVQDSRRSLSTACKHTGLGNGKCSS